MIGKTDKGHSNHFLVLRFVWFCTLQIDCDSFSFFLLNKSSSAFEWPIFHLDSHQLFSLGTIWNIKSGHTCNFPTGGIINPSGPSILDGVVPYRCLLSWKNSLFKGTSRQFFFLNFENRSVEKRLKESSGPVWKYLSYLLYLRFFSDRNMWNILNSWKAPWTLEKLSVTVLFFNQNWVRSWALQLS